MNPHPLPWGLRLDRVGQESDHANPARPIIGKAETRKGQS
jgi:hypothetical protein